MKYADLLKNVIQSNGSKFMTVTFIKKDGTDRTLNCQVYKSPEHTGHNTVSHIQKYVTVILPKRDEHGKLQFRNINCETITKIACAGKTLYIK